MRVKKLIGKIHLWLGLTSGLVVFIVSITGCLYVFQEEVCLLLESGVFRKIEPQKEEFISPLTLQRKVENAFDREVTYMNASVYPSGDRASIVWLRDSTRNYRAYIVNPYTGNIIDTFSYRKTFWSIVLSLHTSLLIPKIGHHIVSISTLIFVALMFSGIYLWFPKSKRGFRQRFKVKWTASPKRLNYDLHNVFGFYMTWIAIFIAISGLVWSYEWVDKSIYWLATGGEVPEEPLKTTFSLPDSHIPKQKPDVDQTLLSLVDNSPALMSYYIEYPYDSTSNYSLTLNNARGKIYNKHNTYQISQYTGEVLDSNLWKEKNTGEKLQEANYNIHVGAILGLPGKIIAFFASLIAASLPITGLKIWLGRKKRHGRRSGRHPIRKNKKELQPTTT